ncbi:HugZ family heme oxygenase [Helicobacter sp. 16-1353]|uniref:HugZ family heme oxygenase n=1 Tax=Helicobacter sp. 16-1353 TaxID=2004996 RepID=UPI000DCD403E|nr:HugZ family heme oxygenase [Helicobacter sp. 16-1353]RAX51711.1 HugZ family heme oxygenase [Helicobacter sp. 16-1353]
MSYESIIKHMNDDHKDALIGVCKKFAGVGEIKEIALKGIDLEGLDIAYDGKNLRVEFPQKATEKTLKNVIIELCQSVPKTYDIEGVKADIKAFVESCGSVCIASIAKDGRAIASYAPCIAYKGKYYIYISEVAEHFESISANPKNLEIMFLQDEAKAKSVILRARLRYRSEAEFVERGSEEFEGAFDEFERKTGGSGGIKTIRKMSDFYLVRLEFKSGRFVKGFGQAYDINGENITFAGDSGNPHKMPHRN